MIYSQGNLVHEYSLHHLVSLPLLSHLIFSPSLPLLNTTSAVIRPKWVCSTVSYRKRLHQRELPHKVIFICTNKEIPGNNFQRCASPSKRKWSPFIRAWDEYSERDLNIIMRLRHFLIPLCMYLPHMFFVLFQQLASF